MPTVLALQGLGVKNMDTEKVEYSIIQRLKTVIRITRVSIVCGTPLRTHLTRFRHRLQ